MTNTKKQKIIGYIISSALLLSVLFVCASCTSLSAVNRNPQTNEKLTEEMRQSLSTLKRVDERGKLYEMYVTFDYYSQAMKEIMSAGGYIKQDYACSAFMTHNEFGEIITGRNFDTNHRAKTIEDADGVYIIYHCNLDGFYRSVSISDARYFGDVAANYRPGALDDGSSDISMIIDGIYDVLDGMNEKGLTVSTLSSDLRQDEKCYDVFIPGQETCVMGLVMRHILDECATVNEAAGLVKRYNVVPYPGGKKLDHLLVSDAGGNSAVIEWRYNEIRIADTDVATNFYQTWDDAEPHKVKTSIQVENDTKLTNTYKRYQYGYGHGYERFNIIASTFQQYAELDSNGKYFSRMSNELARNLLSIVAQQITPEMTSLTQYSVLYNSDRLSADIWLSRDYSKKYSFHIK